MYLTSAPWFSVVALFLQFIPTASCNCIPPLSRRGGGRPPTRAREGGPKDHRAMQKWQRETHAVKYVPGLSTLSYLSRIAAQPPSSFLCCPRPSSHHPSCLTSVYLIYALHLLPPSTPFWPYGTHPFFPHAQTISILSGPLYSLLPFYSSSPTHLFIPNSIHSWHSNQTSQTLHLKNIHFPSLSTSHTPCLFSVQRSWYNYSFIYCRHFLAFIPNPLLLSTLFSAPHALYTSFILCTVPHPFHILRDLRAVRDTSNLPW